MVAEKMLVLACTHMLLRIWIQEYIIDKINSLISKILVCVKMNIITFNNTSLIQMLHLVRLLFLCLWFVFPFSMMCFLHFKLECFNTSMTLVKYKRLRTIPQKSLDLKIDIIVVPRIEDTEWQKFGRKCLGTCAVCLETISEYNVKVDIREIICGHCWLIVFGQDHVQWESVIFCCSNVSVLILQL